MWSERVRAWRESGETAEEFARSPGFAASTLHGWSSRRAGCRGPSGRAFCGWCRRRPP
ncbi:IS66 family insertion sequence element accessory protein TnpA [Sorangium sp. So ce1153]|uniref:IS66 family insertion sequence element accessory protein TnpA n=1 Tax=Sorangium sp. So ce1153 TaxID=3133333 RepID=UPI003F5F5414